MNLNSYKQWVPAIIWNWLRNYFTGLNVIDNWQISTNGGWKYAAKEVAKMNEEGMRRILEGPAIGILPEENLTTIDNKTLDMHQWITQFAYVASRAAEGREKLNVLDFGGGFGTHALVLKRMLPNLRIDYTVCDFPEYSHTSATISQDVRFINDLNQADPSYPLVYASSSIQYTKDWRSLVKELCKLSKSYLYISRTPFIFNSASFIVLQKAYGSEFAGWIFNYRDFVDEIHKHDMLLREVFINGCGSPIKAHVETNLHLGLLFEKTS